MIWLKNKKGTTLIEFVITFTLISIILVIGYNLFTSSLEGFRRQADNVDNQTKARQIIRDISREIRKVNPASSIVIEEDKSISIGDITYTFQEDTNTLLKAGNVFVTGIQSFNPKWDDNGKKISLEITTLSNAGHEITLSSLIYIRE